MLPELDEFLKNEDQYTKLLDDIKLWRSIPLLNYTPSHQLKDLSLVRFRGMIQDMVDPEMYLERYQVTSKDRPDSTRFQEGKYRDCLVLQPNESVDYNCSKNVHGERRTLFVVSLPGLNAWATSYEEHNSSKNNSNIERQDAETTGGVKRSIPDHNLDSEMDYENGSCTSNKQNKRQCKDEKTNSNSGGQSSLSMEYLVNSPLPDRPGKTCMVKIYKDFDSLLLNTMVDVVGFLSVDPALDTSTMDTGADEFENKNEIQAQNPPPSLIPRVHAIAVRQLEHSNPLMDAAFGVTNNSELVFESVYKDLKILLTQCLLGDDLAADYLLNHLISTVYIRSEMQSIGKYSLNLCNLPQNILPWYTESLYSIIESFLPTSHYMPLTLDTLNTVQFFPKKDYETNKLTSGVLQLAQHTHLVLDETKLHTGTLEANGVKGMQSLAHVINSQQIKCDFKFYEIDFDVDIPVLVLSEGKSILPNDFLVPLMPDKDCLQVIEETMKAAKHYAAPKLDYIRRYLTTAKMCSCNMDSADSEMIQTDFVEMRKSNSKVGADELHNLLVLSRLLAIARGKFTFDNKCWEQAKAMESERRARIEKLPKSTRTV